MLAIDLNHYIGGDLIASQSGDLASVSGADRGKQRILRRLLTNPGDYIFHPNYGAGLPQMIGRTLSIPAVRAIIRSQILLEECVAKTPAPTIDVSPVSSMDGGGIFVSIKYYDDPTGQPVTLSFNVTK